MKTEIVWLKQIRKVKEEQLGIFFFFFYLGQEKALPNRHKKTKVIIVKMDLFDYITHFKIL